VKQKKYEPMEDYYDIFLRLCATILQQPNDIYLRQVFQGHGRSMCRRTLAKVIEFIIIIKEELPMRWKNMAKYRQNDFESDELITLTRR
jgi:hypothetical protein